MSGFMTAEQAEFTLKAHAREQNADLAKLLKSRGNPAVTEALKSLTLSGDGGILAPQRWLDAITNPADSPMLPIVSRINVSTNKIRVPRWRPTNQAVPDTAAVAWTSRDTPQAITDEIVGHQESVDIDLKLATVQGPVSISLMEDSAVLGILQDVLVRAVNLSLESAMFNGTGGDTPHGLNEAGVVARVAAKAAAIAYDDLLALYYALPRQYVASATWVMNNATAHAIALLKDTAGAPLWTPGGMLFGRPVVISDFCENIATGKTPIWFGDFKGYTIISRTGAPEFRVLDQPGYSANLLIVALRFRAGGRVTWPDGLRGLQMP
jgi:HK97 family phage major capsid protein